MAAVRSGELAAMAPLFDRHSRRLFGFLRGMVGSPSAAEDLVQETFLRALRYRRSYRGSKPFVPWLLTIARNAARDQLKRGIGRVEELPELADARSPEHDHLCRERARRIASALEKLSSREREVLLLSYFEGLKHREIAKIVGSTRGAVKVRLHRARRALKELLDPGDEPL